MGRVVLLLALFISPSSAWARVPLLDGAIGLALDQVLSVAGRADVEFTAAFRPVADAELERRAQLALAHVRSTGGAAWRYDTRLVLIAGIPGEPNAFCTGPTFYVSRELVRSLDDHQLAGVIAHEMAHAEEGHLTQRMTHSFAAILIQFGRLIASDFNAVVTGGNADAFMKDLWRRGHWAMIQEMLLDAELGQEMQADCFASKWLGRPADIATALSTLVGVSTQALIEGDPVLGRRVSNLLAGTYDDGRCD